MHQVTGILQSFEAGDPQAAEELLPLVYQELRRLAAARMSMESPGQTLQATALVHEAWIRLSGQRNQHYQNRRHFYGAAAEAMRRILVENARRKRAQKHGGGQPLLDIASLDLPVERDEEKILLVHEALERLAALQPDKAEVVKLRYFVGLTHQEIANLLGVSEKTIKRQWMYAKAWLLDSIEQERRAES